MGRAIAILGLVVVTLSWGCATSGRDFDSTRVSQIEKGKTTRAEIDQWFGAPAARNTITGDPGGTVLRYTYVYAKATWAGASSQGKSLVVDFDGKDVVTDVGYSEQ